MNSRERILMDSRERILMNSRERILINELKREINNHKEQIQYYNDHIKRNTSAKESHESKCAEAQEILYKLEGFK